MPGGVQPAELAAPRCLWMWHLCCGAHNLLRAPRHTPRSDFSANARRNERFMLELSRAVQEGQLAEGECVEGYAAAGGGATIG